MIFVPILAPLALAAGIDPLQFAIVVIVLNLTLGMITPPVGALLFDHFDRLGRIDGQDVARAGPDARGRARRAACCLTLIPPCSTHLPGVFGYTR